MLHARKDYNEWIQDSENKIPADEPVFLLRGQDIHAPALLDIYVAISKASGNFDYNIVHAISSHANAMRDWQARHGYKIADMNPEDMVY